jgi:hypothetical protein
MHIARRAVVVACVIFAGAVFGDVLQWLLPSHHLADAKGTITTVQGLVSLLLALVLGLLIWTSYGIYAQQQSEALTLGTQFLQLDVELDCLGTQAAPVRELMRRALISARKRFWGEDPESAPLAYSEARGLLAEMNAFFRSLTPTGDAERTAIDVSRSISTTIVQTHFLMGRQLRNPVPKAMINSVILWAILLFCCIGIGATVNALAVIAQFLGAVAVASAIFLILEFSQPYVGFFRIPPTGIDQAIAAWSKAQRGG